MDLGKFEPMFSCKTNIITKAFDEKFSFYSGRFVITAVTQ